MRIEEHIPLAPLTTFYIGGPARYFVRVKNREELQEFLYFARDKKLTTFFLGGGSNVLVRDEGFDGLVIKIEIGGVEWSGDKVRAGAGESWDALCERAVQKKLWGVENLSGIPGSVGGAVVQNIGAYGAALSQCIEWVEAYDTETQTVLRLNNAACEFSYRDSVFKKYPGRYVVLRAALALRRNGVPNTSYKDLADSTRLNLVEMRERVLEIRKGKFPDIALEGTAGSYFKNPIMPTSEAKKLQRIYPEMPLFALPETGEIKVPLAWLLDRVLHIKGLRVGRARLFERQPLVIVAGRGAACSEVRALAQKVKEMVEENFNIVLEEEVRVVF